MRRLSFGLIAAIAVASASPATANTDARDGTLLASQPCPSNSVRSYEDYLKSVRAELDSEAAYARQESKDMPRISEARLVASLPTREEVEEHLAFRGFECRVITYASGGLKIAGLLWKPIDTTGKKHPLIIALRGGNNKFGPMEPWRYWGWWCWLY